MKRFLHFKQAKDLVCAFDDVLAFQDVDCVSVTHSNPRGKINCRFVQLPANKLGATFSAAATAKQCNVGVELNADSGALVSFARQGIRDKLDMGVTFASSRYVFAKRVSPFLSNCAAALEGTFHTPAADWSMLLALKHQRMISMVTSFSAPFADVSFGSFITEKTNSLEAAVMTSLGPFASLKGDIKVHQLEALEIGWVYRMPRVVGFLKTELVKKVMHFGVVGKLDEDTRLAFLAKLKSGFFGIETGLHAVRVADLKARMTGSGQLDMEMNFRPSKLVGITLRTRTSAKTRFYPVEFGFSLSFDTSELLSGK